MRKTATGATTNDEIVMIVSPGRNPAAELRSG